ncbi:MAG: ABC transporter ATP-binding protein [candidate division Zixibacteria bacterium]|nr:ABC transporter ATP-binding protein [candidate division Zixibacteria bacterium]
MSVPLVEIQQLQKSFQGREVLRGVNIKVHRGESIVVIGQSGCGKSVLLKHVIRLLEPDQGAVLFDGGDISELEGKYLTRMRRRLGMLFQSAALFDSMTVAENVGLGLKESRRHTEREITQTVHEKLEMVGLTEAAGKQPAELSGGMRKRVGMARAIATDPEVLLYDEPTTGLDPITADMINDLIVNLNQKLNVTSIAVTHDMISAYKIADRIVMLYNGGVQFDGTPDEIKNTGDPIVRQFISGSATGPIHVR